MILAQALQAVRTGTSLVLDVSYAVVFGGSHISTSKDPSVLHSANVALHAKNLVHFLSFTSSSSPVSPEKRTQALEIITKAAVHDPVFYEILLNPHSQVAAQWTLAEWVFNAVHMTDLFGPGTFSDWIVVS